MGISQRVIRKGDFLYIWNIKPGRWPAGAPQKYDPENPDVLLPMYGLDKNGKYIPDAAFMDIDDCPSKTFIIEEHDDRVVGPYFDLAVEKRPEVELFNVVSDPYCLENLAGKQDYAGVEEDLKNTMMAELKKTKDPRVVGPDKEIFDNYKRYSRIRKFPPPAQSQ